MYYRQDWIMMQIEAIMKFIHRISEIEVSEHCFESNINVENELLKNKIENLIKDNRFYEAESIIFEKIDSDDSFDIRIAFWFYENVNSFSDLDLEKSNYSRKRILDGINKVCQKSKALDPNTIELLIKSIE